MEKIKGIALLDTVKALRSMREQSAKVLRPELHGYLDEKIFPSRWYPESEGLELLEALVAVIPPRPDDWEWIGRIGAERDLTDVYAAFLLKRRPGPTLLRYPKIWSLYHDSGEATAEAEGDRAVTLELISPLMGHEGFRRLQTGHFTAIAELAGARGVRGDVTSFRRAPAAATWRLSWDDVDER